MEHISNVKYEVAVPALERGLRVLHTLQDGRPRSLELISRELKIPKASLLRICSVLESMALIHRDEHDKRYQGLLRLVPIGDSGEALTRLLQRALISLTTHTGFTAEWYVARADRLVLEQRDEPRDEPVRVIARIGFERKVVGELEAVACAACAAGAFSLQRSVDYWIYSEDGSRQSLSTGEANTLVEQARAHGWASDRYFNSNGVRRLAVAVERHGEFAGVLALAIHFRPGLAGIEQQLIDTLMHERARLMKTGPF